MRLNPGKIYKKLELSDPERQQYGLIPKMAAGSKACTSFLPAASFCERVNSVAKDVMTDARLLMKDNALEKMVVLRINRKFMEYMCKKHNNLTHQQFGRTVIEVEETDEEKTSRDQGIRSV